MNLREKNILTTVECHRLMGRGDFDKCLRAGWIGPCAWIRTPQGQRPRFTRSAVERCEARIAAGESPAEPEGPPPPPPPPSPSPSPSPSTTLPPGRSA